MNTVPYFLLGTPIPFKGICNIYPLTLGKRISLGDEYLTSIFLPYMLTDEFMADKYGSSDTYAIIISDTALLTALCESLRVLCNAEKIQLDKANCRILIDDSETPMDSDAFKEFSKIVRDWNCIALYKPEQEPIFKTEEGRKQWLKLKEYRSKNAKVENDFLGSIINVIQFGGSSFIKESTIMEWTYWKIANVYHAITSNREYEHAFSAYLQGGKKDLVKQHWTERLKAKL